MTIEQILKADRYKRKTVKDILALIEGTKFEFIEGTNMSSDPHLIVSHYQLDEHGNPIVYTSKSIHNSFSQIREIAVKRKKNLQAN